MAKARYWGIRHVREDLTLPDAGRQGQTYAEPVPFGSEHPPRLFHTRSGARRALTWWLKDRTVLDRSISVSPEGHNIVYENRRTESVPGRRCEDWAFVPITLEISDAED